MVRVVLRCRLFCGAVTSFSWLVRFRWTAADLSYCTDAERYVLYVYIFDVRGGWAYSSILHYFQSELH